MSQEQDTITVDTNFIFIDDQCYCLTSDNRFRRHWRNNYRQDGIEGTCKCGFKGKLTQHHTTPLRELPNKEVEWLCEGCHKKVHMTDWTRGSKANYIKNCGRQGGNHKVFFDRERMINYCIECGVLHKFEQVSDNRYKTIECIKVNEARK